MSIVSYHLGFDSDTIEGAYAIGLLNSLPRGKKSKFLAKILYESLSNEDVKKNHGDFSDLLIAKEDPKLSSPEVESEDDIVTNTDSQEDYEELEKANDDFLEGLDAFLE